MDKSDTINIPRWLWGLAVLGIGAWMSWVSVKIQEQSISAVEVKTILSTMVVNGSKNDESVRELLIQTTELRMRVLATEQKLNDKGKSP